MIHRDPTCQRQLKALEKYVLEELNTRTLTLASEDSRYGVQLRAEPDSERLGKRLKGEFKKVAPAVKALTSQQLNQLQESGGEIQVLGHALTLEDIKVSVSCLFVNSGAIVCLLIVEQLFGVSCFIDNQQLSFKECECVC